MCRGVDEFQRYLRGRVIGDCLGCIRREGHFKIGSKVSHEKNKDYWLREGRKERALCVLLWTCWICDSCEHPHPELLCTQVTYCRDPGGSCQEHTVQYYQGQPYKAVSNLWSLPSGSQNSMAITGHFRKAIFSRIYLRKVMLLAYDFEVRC